MHMGKMGESTRSTRSPSRHEKQSDYRYLSSQPSWARFELAAVFGLGRNGSVPHLVKVLVDARMCT